MITRLLKLIVPSRASRRALRSLQASLKDTAQTLYREARYGNRSMAPAAGSENLRVNVGCGELAVAGWINLDAAPPTGLRRYYNALGPLPFPDGAVEHLHAEHFLEHLEYLDGLGFLKECHRVLRPNGSIRIIVPDLEKYLTAYCANDRPFFEKFVDLGASTLPLSTRALVCNQMFRMGGDHKFAWDFETLARALGESGFGTVQRSGKDQVDIRYRIDGQDWWREAESLYVNAGK